MAVNLQQLAPAAVRAPAEFDDEEAPGLDLQALAQVLSSAKFDAPAPGKRGAATLSDLAGKTPSRVSRGSAQIVPHLARFNGLSETVGLMKTTGAAARMEDAAAKGSSVTLFLNRDDKLSSMGDMALVHMKQPKGKDAAKTFMDQHVVMDFDDKFASAQFSMGGTGAAIETEQAGAHISIQDDPSDPTETSQLAVMHDDDGKITAASKIEGTYLTPQGHTFHFLSAPLIS